jgi:hypothetical protein
MSDANRKENETSIVYEEARDLACHQDEIVRAALARREDVPPEILYFLAEDDAPEVRRTIAQNDIAPSQASLLLAKDVHAGVRSDLAAKLAVRPTTDEIMGNQTEIATLEALRILAVDQVPDVREVLANSIKDVSGAPSDVIKTLARDSKLEVCGPVLEYSPVLEENDLVDLVETIHTPGALNFISRREHVQEKVSDAIVGTNDVDAITDLLSNHGAQIREKTLDHLVTDAEDQNDWHAPLCNRPVLSDIAISGLEKFVAGDLFKNIKVSSQKGPVDRDTEIANKLLSGFGDSNDTLELEKDLPVSERFLRAELPLEKVAEIYSKKGIADEIVDRALNAQDYVFVLTALIIKTQCEEETARRIFADQSPKGIVGLCVVADFSAKLAVKIQQRMGRIPPDDVIKPEGGAAIMSKDNAKWQIGFYAKLAKQIN